jgi:NitT/TauT family transport system substrate-binding protein
MSSASSLSSRAPRFRRVPMPEATICVLMIALSGAALVSPASAATRKTAKKTTKVTAKATVKAAPTTAAAPGTAAVAAPATKAKGGTLRLGYFPNVTHAPAIAAVEGGFITKALGPDVKVQTSAFNAGPAAVEALLSGAIDASYVGPNPAINAFVRSQGKAIRIVAGSTSGGAFLVVKNGINTPADLKGKKIATPQLGGTQDVALRYWLKQKGLSSTLEGGGDVSVVPQDNAQTLETFRAGQIDGAWVPEPWATRLVLEGGAKVLLDERNLWPKQAFTTTILIVRTDFLKDHPDLVEGLIAGQVNAIDYLLANPAKGQDLVNTGIEKLTGRKLSKDTISNSWVNLTFTNDPELASMRTAADHAVEVGLLEKVSLTGIEDLTLLNKVLVAAGKKPVVE